MCTAPFDGNARPDARRACSTGIGTVVAPLALHPSFRVGLKVGRRG